jgi:opacity protein-like surface antigen
MIYKALPLLIIVSLISLEAHTQDENAGRFYLKMDLGNSFPTGSFKHLDGEDYYNGKVSSTWLAGIGTGYDLNKNIRADVALTHRDQYKFRYSQGSLFVRQNFSNNSLMANFYYNFANFSTLTPYINFGIGISSNYSDNYAQYINSGKVLSTQSKTKYDLAWSTGIGLQTKLISNLYADLSVKYVSLGDLGDLNYVEPDGVNHFSNPGSMKNTELTISVIYKY